MNKIYKIKYTKYLMRGGAPPPCGPENEVLNEGSGCSSCSGPKAFKAKNKSNEN